MKTNVCKRETGAADLLQETQLCSDTLEKDISQISLSLSADLYLLIVYITLIYRNVRVIKF